MEIPCKLKKKNFQKLVIYRGTVVSFQALANCLEIAHLKKSCFNNRLLEDINLFNFVKRISVI